MAVDLLHELAQSTPRAHAFAPRVLVLAAHPDDEVIGVGGALARFADAFVLHATDGAPLDEKFARDAGFEDRDAYAEARRREGIAALALAGIDERRIDSLGCIDQRASFELERLLFALRDRIDALRPTLLITHAYEGGHADHDACRFLAESALALLARDGVQVPQLVEMSGYHAHPETPGELRVGAFLDHAPTVQVSLSHEEGSRKRAMLAAHATQRAMLEWLAPSCSEERLRTAPSIDWSRPPHEGALHYERAGWGTDGAAFRARVRALRARLSLEGAA